MKTCDECGYDESDNDGPLTYCPKCERELCDRCYADTSFEWCVDCRVEEREKRIAEMDGGGK